ncbi:glycosyltransferase family 2 protein [Flavobacteriaceae bacterium]|nr:glycosyltransferase family 2 protein [Flavobacteriaceae bacterium]
MKEPKIAIIIINWNTYQLTFNCLGSLERCSYKNKKVYFVDNGSTDGSGDKIALEFSEINYIKNEKNEGFTGANNKALKVILKQNFDYVLLLNNDTEVNPNFLSLLVARMESDKNLAATQPLILDLPDKKTIWNAGGSYNTFFCLFKTRYKGIIYKPKLKIDTFTEWISGCCVLVKTAVIREVGLLDNRFFAYFEDADWSIRMTNLGYTLGIVPKSIIYHHSSASTKKNNASNEGNLSPYAHYLNVRNHIYLIKKHTFFNRKGSYVYQILKITSYSIYFILRFRLEKLKMVWRGMLDGINTNNIKQIF